VKRYDATERCPKCGATKRVVRWQEVVDGNHAERMVCRCETCGYTWERAPLDAPKEAT